MRCPSRRSTEGFVAGGKSDIVTFGMKIQINSDKQIPVHEAFAAAAKADLLRALRPFVARLTRLEVHLSDVNSDKGGSDDKRCLLEARPARQKPVSVSADAATVDMALASAAGKMKRRLATLFAKAGPRPAPVKPALLESTASARKTTAKRNTTQGAETIPNARGVKKKVVYRARRKAWPKRGR
ncbi:MAG TPA: hypothetical protein VH477_20885 [Bryobacteraceae bacterium]